MIGVQWLLCMMADIRYTSKKLVGEILSVKTDMVTKFGG